LFWFGCGFGAFVLRGSWRREKGEKESIVYLGHTLHLVGLGLGGLGNLWRFPGLGILPSWLEGKSSW